MSEKVYHVAVGATGAVGQKIIELLKRNSLI